MQAVLVSAHSSSVSVRLIRKIGEMSDAMRVSAGHVSVRICLYVSVQIRSNTRRHRSSEGMITHVPVKRVKMMELF